MGCYPYKVADDRDSVIARAKATEHPDDLKTALARMDELAKPAKGQKVNAEIAESQQKPVVDDADMTLLQLAEQFAKQTTTRENFRNTMSAQFTSHGVTDAQRGELFETLGLTKGAKLDEFNAALDGFWSKRTASRKERAKGLKNEIERTALIGILHEVSAQTGYALDTLVTPLDSSDDKPTSSGGSGNPPPKKPPVANAGNGDQSVSFPLESFGVSSGTSKKARIELNAQARATIARGGPYTEDDKAILRQYSGNGGCGDSLNEFYTLPEVASSMWSVAQRLGVKGSVLEPSCGPGVFLHTAPVNSKVIGVERDKVSADIATALHSDQHEVNNSSLEQFSTQDARQFDGVLGNVPFGKRGGLVKDDKRSINTAEAYFFDTSMDKCKSGRIVGLIVPTGIMDGSNNRKLREMLLRKGQFLGVQRMPNTAFEHSHTGVTTDVVWFRKFPDDIAGALSSKAVSQYHLKTLGIWDDEFLAGSYFTGRGAANVLGKMEAGWRAKAGFGADITVEGSMKGVPEAFAV